MAINAASNASETPVPTPGIVDAAPDATSSNAPPQSPFLSRSTANRTPIPKPTKGIFLRIDFPTPLAAPLAATFVRDLVTAFLATFLVTSLDTFLDTCLVIALDVGFDPILRIFATFFRALAPCFITVFATLIAFFKNLTIPLIAFTTCITFRMIRADAPTIAAPAIHFQCFCTQLKKPCKAC